MLVYVHGAGRPGRAGWPAADPEGAVFADLSACLSVEAKVELLGKVCVAGDVVVAHSAGAIPTVLAVDAGLLRPSGLVLVEPALYDIARGVPAVEAHIAAITQARELTDSGDLFGSWSIIRPIMFDGPADATRWDAERERAERFLAIDPPWGYGVRPGMISRLRTLVVTGGWSAEYEAIAGVLAAVGARHRIITGHRHRPQDAAEFEPMLRSFTRCDARHAHSPG